MKYLDPSKIIKDRVIVCVGTRPSFVKMAPIILELEKRGADYKILHTGQHYSPDLANIYKELKLRDPDYHIPDLETCKTHAEQTARVMTEAEKCFLEEKPETVLVCGDANFNFACGLAARKLRLILGHVESGLRCYDRRVPEEHNRRMLDHISDYLFAPTIQSVINLARECTPGLIVQTGNTAMDTLNRMMDQVIAQPSPSTEAYVLMTVHREENVDDIRNLRNLKKVVAKVKSTLKMPIIFPAHPRTVDRLKKAKINLKVKMVSPMPYIEFLATLLNSSLVLTDSGGVQEEACALQIPCVVLRDSTERVESVAVGASIVAGLNARAVGKASQKMLSRSRTWPNPYVFMDANAAGRIVNTIFYPRHNGVENLKLV